VLFNGNQLSLEVSIEQGLLQFSCVAWAVCARAGEPPALHRFAMGDVDD